MGGERDQRHCRNDSGERHDRLVQRCRREAAQKAAADLHEAEQSCRRAGGFGEGGQRIGRRRGLQQGDAEGDQPDRPHDAEIGRLGDAQENAEQDTAGDRKADAVGHESLSPETGEQQAVTKEPRIYEPDCASMPMPKATGVMPTMPISTKGSMVAEA